MGGSDDPSNLVELTIEEHVEAHKKLWEEHGRWQDRIAWLTLSGQISGAEATRLKIIESNKTRVYSKETKDKISKSNKGKRKSIATEFKKGIRVSPNTEFKSGNIPWTKGIKNWMSDDHKKAIVESNKKYKKGLGLRRSEEQKQKISKSLKGKNVGLFNGMSNIENRKKVSESKIGRKRIYREDGSFYMSERTR